MIKRASTIILIVLSVGFFTGVRGETENNNITIAPELEACFGHAAQLYNLDKDLLIAVGITESNLRQDAINKNMKQPVSLDIGLMQINSMWWPLLAEHGIQPQHLFDPCTNIHVGAWILADSVSRYGNNWRAVGAYNAGTGAGERAEHRRAKYVEKVYRNYLSVSGDSLR